MHMAKKTKASRFKRWWTVTRSALTPLHSDGHTPMLELHRGIDVRDNASYIPLAIFDKPEDVARRNIEKLEVAKLEQDRDAVNKNLRAQHRLMLAALAAVVVAILSSIVAVIIALHTKAPTVIIKGTNVKETIQTTN